MFTYARIIDSEYSPEVLLGFLMAESSVRIKYPTKEVARVLDNYNLEPDDKISDLIKVVQENGGLTF